MKDNIFTSFVEEYNTELKRLRSISDKYKCFILHEFSNLFDFIGAKKNNENHLKILYKSIERKLDTESNNILDNLKTIESFVYFLRFAEKCFMYTNSDNKHIYCEIDTDKNKSIFYFKKNDYKVKITFEESKIKSPSQVTFPFNLLEEERNIVFINIEINRLFGKQMQNTFKFIYDENIKFNDYTDNILLDFVIKDIFEEILKTFEEIVNIITMHNYPIFFEDWEYFINHGIYLKKKRGNKET